MKTSRFTVFTLLACLFCATAFAQSTERVKRRAKQRTNQRVDQKVDEAVDKVFDDLFGKKKKTEKPEDAEAPESAEEETARPGTSILDRIGGNSEPWEPVRNDYPMSFQMAMTTTKNGKTDAMILDIALGEWMTGYRMIDPDKEQVESMRIIFDNQEGTMTTISKEEGKEPRGMQMSQRMLSGGNFSQKVEDQMDEYSFRKTGRTQVIDGYTCEEVEITGPEGSGVSWVTNEIELDWSQVVQGLTMGMRGKQTVPGMDAPYEGFPIESSWTDAKGKETTVARYRNILLGDAIDRSLFDTGEVEIQKIGY